MNPLGPSSVPAMHRGAASGSAPQRHASNLAEEKQPDRDGLISLSAPSVAGARAERSIVTLLTSENILVSTRVARAQKLCGEHSISGERLHSLAQHALEIAILRKDSSVLATIERLLGHGACIEPTFKAKPERIGGCSSADVYNLSDHLVIKVARNLSSEHDRMYINREREYIPELFDKGVSVPRPVPFSLLAGRLGQAFPDSLTQGLLAIGNPPRGACAVMERIYGEAIPSPSQAERHRELFGSTSEETERMLKQQLRIDFSEKLETHPKYLHALKVDPLRHVEYEKASACGFNISDDQWHNAIYSSHLDQIFLIDFSWWQRSNPVKHVVQSLKHEALSGIRFWAGTFGIRC